MSRPDPREPAFYARSVKQKQEIDFPIWGGVAAIVVGGVLLVFGGKKG